MKGKEPRRGLFLLAAAAGALVVAALLPASAHAGQWDMVKSSNGVVVNRSGDSTNTALVRVYHYWNYKGGSTWSATTANPYYAPTSASSYNNSREFQLSGTWGEAFEVPLHTNGGRCQAVRVVQEGEPDLYFCVLYEPLNVNVQNGQTINSVVYPPVPVAVQSAPPVTLDSSVSVDGTLTADVASVSWLGSDEQTYAVAAAFAFLAGFAFALNAGGIR